MTELTQELLCNLLDYNPVTGVLVWKVSPSRPVRAGSVAGSVSTAGHIQIKIFGKIYQAHQIIWFMVYGHWPTKILDHEDTNKTNNALDNLREATYAENSQNRTIRCDNLSGFKGVSKSGSKWMARIWDKSKNVSLGAYPSPQEAAQAYDRAAIALFGAFAKTNASMGLI